MVSPAIERELHQMVARDAAPPGPRDAAPAVDLHDPDTARGRDEAACIGLDAAVNSCQATGGRMGLPLAAPGPVATDVKPIGS
jgi:hypothetical protein